MATWILAILPAAILLSVDYLPTHDGPQHIYSAWLLNHWDEHPWLHAVLALNPQRITSFGFEDVFRPLERVLPWRTAAQLTLGVIASFWTTGCLVALGAWRGSVGARAWWIALIPLGLPWMVLMGHFNFFACLAAMPWLMYIAEHVAHPPPSQSIRQRGLMWLLLVLGFAWAARAHIMAAALMGGALAITATVDALLKRDLWLWLRFVGPGVPVGAVGLLARHGVSSLPARGQTESWSARLELAMSSLTVGPDAFGAVLWTMGVVGSLCGVLAGRDTWAKGLGMAGLVYAATFAFAPLNITGWDIFGPRFGTAAVLLGAMAAVRSSVRLPTVGRWPLVLIGVATVGTLSWSIVVWHGARVLERSCAPAFEPIALPPRARLVSLALTGCGEGTLSRAPIARWLANLDAVHAIDNGLLPDVWVSQPAIHAFAYIGERPMPEQVSDWAALDAGRLAHTGNLLDPPDSLPLDWLMLSSYLASQIAQRDLALIWGPQEAPVLEGVRQRGVVTLGAVGHLQAVRYLGCAVELEATRADRTPADLLAGVRFYPDLTWHKLDDSPSVSGSVRTLRVPCGPIALRAVWDDNGDGIADDSEPHCVDAAGASEWRVIIRNDLRPRITCLEAMPEDTHVGD